MLGRALKRMIETNSAYCALHAERYERKHAKALTLAIERGCLSVELNDLVREHVQKYRRAKTEASKHKHKSMINNVIGYEILSTGKSAELIRKEWGLSDDYK